MSVHVMSEVFAYSTATLGSRLVLLAIADCADKETRTAWPSVAYLATAARLSESAVHRALRTLATSGELEIIPQSGRSNLYRVLELTGAASGSGVKLTGVSPEAPAGAATDTPRVPLAAPKPSVNRKDPSERARARKPNSAEPAWKQVPDGELLTDARRQVARSVGLHPARVAGEWQKFAHYVFPKPKRSVDQTWQNWCVRALAEAWSPPPDPAPPARRNGAGEPTRLFKPSGPQRGGPREEVGL